MDKQKLSGDKQPEKTNEKSVDKKDGNYKEKMNQKHAKKIPKGRK